MSESRSLYITTDGSLSIENTTLYFSNKLGKQVFPIESVEEIFFLASGTVTTGVLSYLSKKGIVLHFFGRYGNYVGSFIPKKTLLSGEILVRQVKAYLSRTERAKLARKFIEGSIANYNHILRRKGFPVIRHELPESTDIAVLMQSEGAFKKKVYSLLDDHLEDRFKILSRRRRPPLNEANAVISFLNSLTYAVVSTEIFHTHLSPEISYLHEPFQRRFSLSLDVAEIFKPLLSEKIFLDLVNRKMLKEIDFETSEGVFLSEIGRRKVIKLFDEELNRTIRMRTTNAKRRIRRLIRIEIYKLEKHLLGIEEYKPLHAWW